MLTRLENSPLEKISTTSHFNFTFPRLIHTTLTPTTNHHAPSQTIAEELPFYHIYQIKQNCLQNSPRSSHQMYFCFLLLTEKPRPTS
jgi:hypothetical protein